MKEFSSCKKAVEFCISNKSFAIAHLYQDERPMDMHIHDCYEIYYSISGGKQFLIDNHFYTISPRDLFFINQYESHHLTKIDSLVHERIVISIYPEYLAALSSKQTDLTACFTNRNGSSPHQVHLDIDTAKRFIYFIHRLSDIQGFGTDLIERSIFTEFMVYSNKVFLKNSQKEQTILLSTNHKQVDEILAYINKNIASELTLDCLSKHFYLSSSYLCRIFKSATGTTINKYIIAKRITLAKNLLNSGLSVTETCEHCGFNDYSNFLKSFTKAVGISPKKYAQFNI